MPHRISAVLVTVLVALVVACLSPWADGAKTKPVVDGPTPQWIWTNSLGDGQTIYLYKTFEMDGAPKSATLTASCDNHMRVAVNGKVVAQSDEWNEPATVDVTKLIKPGQNTIVVQAKNDGGVAAFVAAMKLDPRGQGRPRYVVTDTSWKVTPKAIDGWDKAGFDAVADWEAPKVIGKLGDGPWNNVFAAGGAAIPNGTLSVAEGFKVEQIYSVPKGTQGSWVSLTAGPKGELYASDQGGAGIYKIVPPALGSEDEATVTKVNVNVSNAHGMVWAFDSLYINRNGDGGGVWRITDSNGDGELDKAEQVVNVPGGGEHGPHAVIKTADGKGLYICAGNHTHIPPDLTGTNQPSNWDEDLLLPRQWDARGHARGILAPGGWVARISPDGKQQQLFANGFRNLYDIALNEDGEMFTFDSDMEWDFGLPWYRPTRICHIVSGAEFGWRSGAGKWPTYYPDSLPPVVEIGPASPTGVLFGTGAKFPAKWQRALFALDWTYGTIWAIHLKPDGASYDGKVEEFVSGKPLPVTDATIGTDGVFYFTVGGRGTQSGLYRVTYTGSDPTGHIGGDADDFADLRALRHKLEAFHGRQDAAAVATAYPYLGHADRHIRFAARIALEAQPVESWQSRVLGESDPEALITGAVALARQGKPEVRSQLLKALNGVNLAKLAESQQLEALRAYQLVFARMGRPSDADSDAVTAKLNPMYPSTSDNINRELCRLLVYLRAPGVVGRTIKLITEAGPTPAPEWQTVLDRNGGYGGTASAVAANMPPLQGIQLAYTLRNLRNGWTIEQRRAYFQFLREAANHPGGASFPGYLNNIRSEALANCSNVEREAVADLTGDKIQGAPDLASLPKPKGPGKDWQIDEVVKLAESKMHHRDFENGKRSFQAVLCAQCHRFDGFGGDIGPDLSSVGNKFSVADLLDSIINPSNVISDQYESTTITKKDGSDVTGRIVAEDNKTYKVSANPFAPNQLISVDKADVAKLTPSKVSAMVPKLINALNEDELLDLIAYLRSGGNRKDRMFK
ncbi:MAG: c-type cytochrome [Phycisphaera sp.]|nr:c-type cytochrome [Phycisphaera sp.]